MIKVVGLTKKYGNKLAVNDISFQIEKNGVVGFLGPNGAGKSTVMNILTGYISATEGTVEIGGADILRDPIAAKRQIGYLPEMPPLYKDLTILEYLNYVYGLKRCTLPRQQEVLKVCREVGIAEVRNRLIGSLSKGYQQRVGIAQALIGNPPILILDEPTVGLDPSQIIEIRNLVKRLGKTRIIILSTHILSEVQLMCERLIIISRGTIAVDDLIENIEAESSKKICYATILGDSEKVCALLKSVNGIAGVDFNDNRYRIESSGDFQEARVNLFYALAENRFPLIQLSENTRTLESLFLELTESTYSGTREEL